MESYPEIRRRQSSIFEQFYNFDSQSITTETVAEKPLSLTHYESSAFAAIMGELVNKIIILDECNTPMRLLKANSEMDDLLKNKFSIDEKVVDELAAIDQKKLACSEYKLEKMEADRTFLKQVLTDTCLELSSKGRAQSFVDWVHRLADKLDSLEKITAVEAQNKQQLRDLHRQLRQKRNQTKSTTYEADSNIESIKSLVQDAALNAATRSRYIGNWQQARAEQHLQSISDHQTPPAQNIDDYKMKLDQEHRVHTEMELLISIIVNDTLVKVEYWMSKYERDTEKLDLQIQMKSTEYDKMCERRAELEKTNVIANIYNTSTLEEIYEDGEEVDIENKGKLSLSTLQASLFAIVLQDTITEISILAECNNKLRVAKAMGDMPLLITHKYQINDWKFEDEFDRMSIKDFCCDKNKLNKLESDRKYFYGVIVATLRELNISNDFQAIKEAVNLITTLDKYQLNIINEEVKNRLLQRELRKQLRQQRNHIKTIVYDADGIIEELKIKVEDSCLNAEVRSRYIENWQQARTEQHDLSIFNTESPASATIEHYKQRFDQEQRIHSEVELLINIAIQETLEKVEEWMNKYDKDMEGIDLKIQYKKIDYQNLLDKRIHLEKSFEKHDALIKEWIKFKEDREKLRVYKAKMQKSAIIVQAWWRGLLVRRQLGPYHIKKKPAKKK